MPTEYGIVPPQIRSTDPWSETRFTDHLNLRSRIYTKGKNVVLYDDSFMFSKETIEENGVPRDILKVGPGMCIIDDVFFHVKESFTLDPKNPDHFFLKTGAVTSYSEYSADTPETKNRYINVFFYYKYSRALPAPKLYIGLTRFSAFSRMDKSGMLWIGWIQLHSNNTISYGKGSIVLPVYTDLGEFKEEEKVVLTPSVISPSSVITSLNGGTQFIGDDNKVWWLDDWLW